MNTQGDIVLAEGNIQKKINVCARSSENRLKILILKVTAIVCYIINLSKDTEGNNLMGKENKRILGFIAFGVILYAALMNISDVANGLQTLTALLLPVFVGLILAFVINVPMKAFEKLYTKIFGKRLKKRSDGKVRGLHGISLLSTFICIILIFILISTMLIPELVSSVTSVYAAAEVKIPQWIDYLRNQEWNLDAFTNWLADFDFKSLIKGAIGGVGTVMDSIVGITTSTVSGVITAGFGLIIAIYVLLSKDDLSRQSKKVLYGYCKKSIADRIYSIAKMVNDTYTKFFSGQCVEAVILGFLIFISLSIFKMPYAGLIGVMTAILSFIPYIGAFLSCAIGALLVLLLSPSKAILFIIVFQVAQFIENQFIYPHVVGNSVGLSALWTLVAVLVGGNFFGILGMIFFIPLTAVIYNLVSGNVNRRLKEKQISIED